MKLSIGIDIGAAGAWATHYEGRWEYGKLPKVSDDFDLPTLFNQLHRGLGNEPDVTYHCVIEDLHSVYGSSAASNFTFGYNNGLIVGFLQSLRIPFVKVGAKRWQKELWEGVRPVQKLDGKKLNKDGTPKYKVDTKATSLIAAKRLFPDLTFLATERSRVPDNNLVDAVLLAEYCRRHF